MPIKKIIKRVLYAILILVLVIVICGLTLAFWPIQPRITNRGITPEVAAMMRQQYTGHHNQFTTADGLTHRTKAALRKKI